MAVNCPACIETDKRIAATLAASPHVGKSCKRCGKTIPQQRIDYVKKHYGYDVQNCQLCSAEIRAERARQQADVDEESRRNPNYRVLNP